MPKKLGRVRHNKTHLDLVFLKANGRKRGEIRLKPNRVLWAEANEKGWHGVSLRKFTDFMKKNGEHQTK
ncbi:MAG: hypothetical protein WBD87_00815 [Candidatus Acidiferrales bacterium]